MTFRRFEMHHYRHVLSRMRLGETDRAIARAGLMGRHKIAQFRQVALKKGHGGKTPRLTVIHKGSRMPPNFGNSYR